MGEKNRRKKEKENPKLDLIRHLSSSLATPRNDDATQPFRSIAFLSFPSVRGGMVMLFVPAHTFTGKRRSLFVRKYVSQHTAAKTVSSPSLPSSSPPISLPLATLHGSP